MEPASTGTPSHMRSEAAALGILAAVSLSYFKRTWPLSYFKEVHPLFPIASLAIGFLCFTDAFRWRGLELTVAPLCLAFTINYLDRLPAFLIRILSAKRLRWIGRISFSLYLWQQPFHFAVCNYEMNAWVAVVLAIGLGIISFYGFEDPIRRRITRI